MEIAKSKDITIRLFEPEDAAEFSAACQESLGTVGKWMPWCHENYSNEEALAWFKMCAEEYRAKNAYDLGIFRNSDSRLVGSIAINQLDKRNLIGNIGYWVRVSMQQQGYAVKAVELIKQYGFQELGLARLEIIILTDNVASRRVAESAGAEFECLAKNRLMHEGAAKTAAIYSFTNNRGDWTVG